MWTCCSRFNAFIIWAFHWILLSLRIETLLQTDNKPWPFSFADAFAASLFCLDSVFRLQFNTGNSFARLAFFPSHIDMHTNTFTHLPCPPLACAPYYEKSSVNTSYSCSTRPKIDQRTSEYQIEAKCPLKIPSILFTSQRWQWPAKILHFHSLCKASSYYMRAAYLVWDGGCVCFPVYSGLWWIYFVGVWI